MLFTRSLALSAITAGFLVSAGLAAETDKKPEDGVAIDGYDPVAYFTDGKPVKGTADFQASWGGSHWRFVSAAHRDRFLEGPEKYAPQYGGFCAYGVAQGHKAPVDPSAWRIVEGKLYLNFNRDVQTLWLKDVPGNIAAADKNWAKILAE